MGILASCECGTRIRVKEELAGKQVQCPRCSRKIAIPVVAKSTESNASDVKSQSVNTIEAKCKCGKLLRVSTKYAGRKAKCPKCEAIISIPFAERSMDGPLSVSNEPDLSATSPFDTEFDELLSNIKPEAVPSSVCPQCSAVMLAGAVLCVTCGYHRQVGARLRTKVDQQIARGAETPWNIFVDEEPRQLKIRVRGELQNYYVLATLSLITMFFLLLLGLGIFLASGNKNLEFLLYLLYLPALIIVLLSIYVIVAGFVNSTTFLIKSDSISIKCGPVPWPIFMRHVSVDEIKQVYIVKKRRPRLPSMKLGEFGALLYLMSIMERGFIAEIYDIKIVHKNGWRFHLFSLNNEWTEVENRFALWLENKIKFTLSVPDVPVISTWYQRYLHFETTQDDARGVESNDAISAKSWLMPQFMLAIVCSILYTVLLIIFFMITLVRS